MKDTRSREPIIQVRDLKLAYGDTVVLEGLSFDIRRGEVFMIVGGSGCGKSTLLKHMIRIYRPLEGEVRICGQDIAAAEGADLRRHLRRFGVTYQSGALFGTMTLLENVRLPLEEFTSLPREAMNLIGWMKLSLVGLEEHQDAYPFEVSGGMQKRAALARAMALDPEILFLDEPSAGLDPATSAALDELILNLSRNLGITFVIVTHELPSMHAIADRVILLDGGARTIVAEGPPEEIREESDNVHVRRFFRREA